MSTSSELPSPVGSDDDWPHSARPPKACSLRFVREALDLSVSWGTWSGVGARNSNVVFNDLPQKQRANLTSMMRTGVSALGKIVYPPDPAGLMVTIGDDHRVRDPIVGPDKRFLDAFVDLAGKVPERGVERRILNAALARIGTMKGLQDAGLNIHRAAFTTANKDLRRLEAGRSIVVRQRFVNRTPSNYLERVVEFLLSPDICNRIYFHVRSCVIDDESVFIPLFALLQEPEVVWTVWTDMCAREDAQPASKSTFLKVMKAVIPNNPQFRTCTSPGIARTTGVAMDTLRQVVRLAVDPAKSQELLLKIDYCEKFLKATYPFSHCGGDEPACTHTLNHSLLGHGTGQDTTNQTCELCTAPFHLIQEIREAVVHVAMVENQTELALSRATQKVVAGMAHITRVVAQRKRLDEIKSELRGDQAIVDVDWAGGIKPMFFHEVHSASFGKAGIPRFVAAVLCRVQDELVYSYIDIVPEQVEMVGMFVTLTLIECVLVTLQGSLPHLRSVILTSDTHANFTTKSLLYFVHRLQGVPIERIVYKGTNDGKGQADRHMGHAIVRARQTVASTGTPITTPRSLFNALAHNPLPATTVMLATASREMIARMESEWELVSHNMNGVTDHAEVEFDQTRKVLTVWANAGIGSGTVVKIDDFKPRKKRRREEESQVSLVSQPVEMSQQAGGEAEILSLSMEIPVDKLTPARPVTRSSRVKEDEDVFVAEPDDFPGRPTSGTPARPSSGTKPASGFRPASAPRATGKSYTQFEVCETRVSRGRGPNDSSSSSNSSSDSSSNEGDDEQFCKRCERSFAPGMRARHACRGGDRSKTLRVRAIKELIAQTQDKPTVFANGRRITRASITTLAPDTILDPGIAHMFPKGWAIRQPDPYIGITMEWKDIARSTFNALEVNGHKTTAEDLHEALERDFKHNRCDIPGLEELRSLNNGFSKASIEAKRAQTTPKVVTAVSQPGPSTEAPPGDSQAESKHRGLNADLAKQVEEHVRGGNRDRKAITEALGVTDEATKSQIRYKINNFSQQLKRVSEISEIKN